MAYLASKLINDAYTTAGIVARNQQTLTAQQSADGLDLLNDLLALKNANNRLIPYFTSYPLNAIIGQETYFIPNLIYADSVTFNLNNIIRIPMDSQTRKQYLGTVRVDTLETIPFEFNINRTVGGANFSIYPLPNSTYPITINGKFGLLSNVTLNLDLSTIYDRLYIVYLRYALAQFICEEYTVSFAPQAAEKLDEIEQQIRDLAPIDLTTQKLSTLQSGRSTINWGFVNLSGGYTPP